jgi:hypothetical protein
MCKTRLATYLYKNLTFGFSTVVLVTSLSPPKPAGLGIPQIGCGTTIAKKNWLAEICEADPRV